MLAGRCRCWTPRAIDHCTDPPLPSSPAPHGRRPPPPFPSLGPRRRADYFQNNAGRRPAQVTVLLSTAPELEPPPPSPPPTCLPHRFPPPETPAPLRFPFNRHCLRCMTVRPSHPPPLSPIYAASTFPLPHRHCTVTPPSPPATGALSPPMNSAVLRLLHRLHAASPFG
jgi:hypothetical protein